MKTISSFFVYLFSLCLLDTVTSQLAVDGTVDLNGPSTSPVNLAAWSPTAEPNTQIYVTNTQVRAGGSITCTSSCTSSASTGAQNLNINLGSAQTTCFESNPTQTGTEPTCSPFSRTAPNSAPTPQLAYVATCSTDTANMGNTVTCTGDITDAPSAAPSVTTQAPTAAPTCSCFSESTTVEVVVNNNKNNNNFNIEDGTTTTTTVMMKDLQVGQEIFAGSYGDDNKPIYETVYGFAHRDVESVVDYLQITTTTATIDTDDTTATTTRTLEISSNHLIFLQGRKDPVPAGLLVVGDVLIQEQQYQSTTSAGIVVTTTMTPATIVSIETIQRRGLYAPLTKDGTVIVNGLRASSYVSINHLVPKVIGTVQNKLGLSEQTFFHWWMAPYRIFCTTVMPLLFSSNNNNNEQQQFFCMDDYNQDEGGYIHWLVIGRKLAELVHGSSNIVIHVGLSVVLCFCGVFMILESLLEKPCSFWFVQVTCALFLWRRLTTTGRSSSSKQKLHQNWEKKKKKAA